MKEENVQRRLYLLIEMLSELKTIFNQLETVSKDIEKYSEESVQRLFRDNKPDIQGELDRYKLNMDKVQQLNCEITSKINSWYKFVKDECSVRKVTFPISFIAKKTGLNKSIKSINEAISSLAIENRFLRENITIWEHNLELKAVRQIRQGHDYEVYDELVNTKDRLIAELRYLIPTIPGLCPIEINILNIDSEIKRLSKLISA